MARVIGSIAGRPVRLQQGATADELRIGKLCVSTPGAQVVGAKVLTSAGEEVLRWTERGPDRFGAERRFFAVAGPGGDVVGPKVAQARVHLRNRSLDPKAEPAALTRGVPSERRLVILQLHAQMLPGYKQALEALGVELGAYLPENAFFAVAPAQTLADVAKLSFVRAATEPKPADKCSDEVRQVLAGGRPVFGDPPSTYHLVPLTPRHRAEVVAALSELGGEVLGPPDSGGLLVKAKLDPKQLEAAIRLCSVTWIEPTTAAGVDVDNARIQGGAAHLEQVAGYTGRGLRGHVLEGIERTHGDFEADAHRQAPIPVVNDKVDGHGHATYGIIYGSGKNYARARGILPEAQGLYTNADAILKNQISRFDLTKKLIDEHKVMFQTASWGNDRTVDYTAISAELDDVIFRLDLPVTQSQSNAGNQMSRPQAWAKNVISIGALNHFDNADPSDDKWNRGASIGPAKDGRLKPDLSAYYDRIATTELGNKYRLDFNGTSGATPIVNGHIGMVVQMWTDGIFGNALPKAPAPDADTRFANRPHASTVKALAIASAQQWPFEGAAHDRTRVHQGWGFPNVRYLYEMRDKAFVVNETDVLKPLETKRYELQVPEGEPELRVSMVYRDPPAAVQAARHRVNDLHLKVTAPDGTTYHGNHGLVDGMTSKPGGEPNTLDTVENVFLKSPAAGKWTVEVTAAEVNQDGNPGTPELDAAFALVALGVKRP